MKYILTIFLSFLILTSCKDERNNIERIQKAGNDFLVLDFTKKNLQTPEIVHLGNGLIHEIEEITKHSKTITITVEEGDFERPFGNNEADYLMKIKSKYKNIWVRFKYNSEKDKFDILGWKTI